MPTEHVPSLLEAYRRLPAAAPLADSLSRIDDIYLVGGAVRDLLLGGRPVDLDFLVDGDVEPVVASLGGSTVAYDRFGTATVAVDGFRYDFARARSETYPRPGALPEVAPADVPTDLRRRDFTVNAMALALGGPQAGTLVSAEHARADLHRRQLRVLHDASFIDDPTRLLRLARYAARLSFATEPRTLELAGAAVADDALNTVSGARAGAELRLAAAEPDPVAAFEELHRLGLDEALQAGFGLTDAELARRALALLPPDGDRAALLMAVAGMGLPVAQLAALLERLALAAGQRDAILCAASGARRVAEALQAAERPSQIAAAVGPESRPELVALAGALGPEAQARQWLYSLRDVRPEIDGRDLLAAGVPAGPAVGRGLRAALEARLDGRAADREGELAAALRAARGNG
jgi:tRNA nucleotidyltransferase (CCA-adding enzyme)